MGDSMKSPFIEFPCLQRLFSRLGGKTMKSEQLLPFWTAVSIASFIILAGSGQKCH